MKPLIWIGAAVLILGLMSLFIPLPNNERHDLTVGGVSVGVDTRHTEMISPVLSAAMILGGLGTIAAGGWKRSRASA